MGVFRGQWTLYYDGDCGLCIKVVRWLRRLDPFRSIRWQASQELETPPAGLTWEEMGRSAYLVTSLGKGYAGFDAFRMLALRLPPLAFLAPLLWLPGVRTIGAVGYRWLAANRCRSGSCDTPTW